MRILVIEDDVFLASILAQKMEHEGFDVSVANNGEDGLKLAHKDVPHVILLDLIMSRLDGFQVLEQLREDAVLQRVPVVVLSNLGQMEDIERARMLGAKEYLIKTHTALHDIVNKVKNYTEEKREG